MKYKTRSKAVIHELLDREIILADLDTGMYFSIRGCGIPIWQLLIAGYADLEISSFFKEKFGAHESVPLFIEQLVNEQLIISDEEKKGSMPPDLFWPASFETPILERYEEMKNLLMLDPIHEVDEQGWPVKADV